MLWLTMQIITCIYYARDTLQIIKGEQSLSKVCPTWICLYTRKQYKFYIDHFMESQDFRAGQGFAVSSYIKSKNSIREFMTCLLSH